MNLTVFIPAAGTGSRLGSYVQQYNKAMIQINNRPAISYIIEKYPQDTKFVIALGYKGEYIREYLGQVYPEYNFCFINIFPYTGKGAGLGYSLYSCKNELQIPFVFHACDTIIREDITELYENWMGYADANEDSSEYRTLSLEHDRVKNIYEKSVRPERNSKIYIGLAGIFDYKLFWGAMTEHYAESVESGEVLALSYLIPHIQGKRFTWFDTGNRKSYQKCRLHFQEMKAPVILEKNDEQIWFTNNKVTKFFINEDCVKNRVLRAKMLKGYVPNIIRESKHMYTYQYVSGVPLSQCINLLLLGKLLETCTELWNIKNSPSIGDAAFQKNCLNFYKKKTMQRVESFYNRFHRTDNNLPINGTAVPYLNDLLETIDWDWIAQGIPCRFHGDLHFENIIYSEEQKDFVFIDWRQDFDGNIEYGDLYYDTAKLLHGMIINHELMSTNQFHVNWDTHAISYDFLRRNILIECEKYFIHWLDEHSLSSYKTNILCALIFLNIAALHNEPYSQLLYVLGKDKLYRTMLHKIS